MQELVAALHRSIDGAVFSSELWIKLGSATTQLDNGKHPDDPEWLELQRQLELADQQHFNGSTSSSASTSCWSSLRYSVLPKPPRRGDKPSHWCPSQPLHTQGCTRLCSLATSRCELCRRAQLDTLVAQALSFRNPFFYRSPFSMLKGRVVDGGVGGGDGGRIGSGRWLRPKAKASKSCRARKKRESGATGGTRGFNCRRWGCTASVCSAWRGMDRGAISPVLPLSVLIRTIITVIFELI